MNEQELDKILSVFSQQSGDKAITLTWSTRDSVSEAKAAILALHEAECARKQVAWLDEQVAHVLFDIYPEDVFTPASKDDYERMNAMDSKLNTRLHCSGIRHGLHVLRREARGLSARDDLDPLSSSIQEGES